LGLVTEKGPEVGFVEVSYLVGDGGKLIGNRYLAVLLHGGLYTDSDTAVSTPSQWDEGVLSLDLAPISSLSMGQRR
jgi:hypothetical protein